jgi:hypothetical protein
MSYEEIYKRSRQCCHYAQHLNLAWSGSVQLHPPATSSGTGHCLQRLIDMRVDVGSQHCWLFTKGLNEMARNMGENMGTARAEMLRKFYRFTLFSVVDLEISIDDDDVEKGVYYRFQPIWIPAACFISTGALMIFSASRFCDMKFLGRLVFIYGNVKEGLFPDPRYQVPEQYPLHLYRQYQSSSIILRCLFQSDTITTTVELGFFHGRISKFKFLYRTVSYKVLWIPSINATADYH